LNFASSTLQFAEFVPLPPLFYHGKIKNPQPVECLNRRIPDAPTLTKEIDTWEADRNKYHAKADWQFNLPNARIKLKRLYPLL
jgi:hypothetical protein